MSYPHFDQVQRAHSELIAEGKIRPRTVPEEVEADKGLLTQRAGYYANLVNPSIGVLEKLEGNNYLGYSTDLHIRLDGTFWDVGTDDSGGVPASPSHPVSAIPVNGGPSGPDPELVPRWRKPTKELAQLPENGGGNGNGGTTPPPTDRTDEVLAAIAASEANVKAHMTSETDRVMQRLADYRQEVINFADVAWKFIVAVGIFRRRE